MNELNEVLQLLRSAMPLLKKFGEWQQQQELKEREEQERASFAEREFKAWIAERRKKQQQEERDADELAKRCYGGETWQRERFFSPRY
jgi:hypothetical protein